MRRVRRKEQDSLRLRWCTATASHGWQTLARQITGLAPKKAVPSNVHVPSAGNAATEHPVARRSALQRGVWSLDMRDGGSQVSSCFTGKLNGAAHHSA